jgi:heat shock protein HtpX
MYSQIDANKRKTWILLSIFSVFVVLLITFAGMMFGLEPAPALIGGSTFAIVYCLISFYVSDKVTLATAGAKEIQKNEHRDLYNLIENLSITAGIPTPKIYVIDDPSPNAFATGRDPNHASVAMTTGLLKVLNKQELQGVLAHEISHIKNYDIRIMTLVVVLIGLVILLADVVQRITFYKSNIRSQKGGPQMLILFFGMILVAGILAPIVSQVIKLAISRTREYLADASGAMLTRYPEGLAGALEKIKTHGTKLNKANHATAHLYISSPFGSKQKSKIGFFDRLFMTHPPIDDRISKLRGMTK